MFSAIKSSFASQFLSRTGSAIHWQSGRAPIKRGQIEPETALQATVVGNCVLRLAAQIAQLDWKSDDPRINRLLQRPNPFQSKHDFFHSLAFDMLLHGVAYVYRDGRDTDIEFALPFEVREVPFQTIKNGQGYYKIVPGDVALTGIPTGEIPAEDVIRLLDVPTSNPRGSARIQLAAEAIRVIVDVAEMVRDVAANGPVLGAIIRSPRNEGHGWAEKAVKAVQCLFGSGKGSKRGGVGAFDNGQTVEPWGPALKLDAETVKYVDAQSLLVCSAYGVPPFMAGIASDSDSKYSNQAQQHASFYRDGVFPLLDRIKQILSDAYGVAVYPDLSRFIAGDFGAAARIATELYVSGLWKKGEARELTGKATDADDDGYIEKPTNPARSDEGMDPNRPRQDEDDDTDGIAEAA